MTIGERIKQKRLEAGFTVDEIADRLGKDRATVYRYESDDIKKMPITILEPLAKVLGTTPAHLMGWEDITWDEPSTESIDAKEELLSLLSRIDAAQKITYGGKMMNDAAQTMLKNNLKSCINNVELMVI